MVALWMCYAALVTALLTAGAWAADRALAACGAPRRWAWAAAVALGLALPAGAAWTAWRQTHAAPPPTLTYPSYTFAAPAVLRLTPVVVARPAPAPLGPTPAPARWAAARARAAAITRQLVEGARAAERVAVRALTPFDRLLLALWGTASAAGIALVCRGALAVRSRRRTWRAARVAGERVWLTPDLGPALVGTVRPRIVLPEALVDALAWPELRLVLAHERAHRDARDPLLLAFALGALVVAPWNAALWPAARRLRLAAEADCDRRVLRSHPDPRRYARLLVDVAERMLAPAVPALAGTPMAALLDPPGLLERRVGWLLGTRPAGARRTAAVAAAGAFGVAALACAVPRPPATAPAPPTTAAPAPARVPWPAWSYTAATAIPPSATLAPTIPNVPPAQPAAFSLHNAAELARLQAMTDSLVAARQRDLVPLQRSTDSLQRADASRQAEITTALSMRAAAYSAAERAYSMAANTAVRDTLHAGSGSVVSRGTARADAARHVLGVARADLVREEAELEAFRRSQVTSAVRQYTLQTDSTHTSMDAARRVDSLLREVNAAAHTMWRNPSAQARFDVAVEALRADVTGRSPVKVLRLTPLPARPGVPVRLDTGATRLQSGVPEHNAAREIALRVPHTTNRSFILILFDSATHVRRAVVLPYVPGNRVPVSAGFFRRIFPELGMTPFSAGTNAALAPNDSSYVAWVRPGPVR